MSELRVVMAHIDTPLQYVIERYEQHGGYQAIKKAIGIIAPEELVDMVQKSSLRGRGGAGFLTGMKWGFLPKDRSKTRYLVCNCDESEPGTFKDRLLIENDPHQVIEGIVVASYAIGAQQAFLYCRGEFFLGIQRLRHAIKEAHRKGYLGKNILGTSFSLTITLHPGAGAYIAGEETAQLNSLEGYRATPRLKPPFPALVGLYGKPTIINNVETLCNVVHIVNRGVAWYQSIGKEKNHGTKIFQISGHVEKPGCYEFPLGVHLREVLDAAGGVMNGRSFKACFPGGSSCSVLTDKDLDIEMDFDTLMKRKSALGTASIIVMDDTTNMVSVCRRLMQFYQNESCGKCTPCREGTRWLTQILSRLEAGKGTLQDLSTIDAVCNNMSDTSFCPLAVGAALPIISTMKEFRAEFEEAVKRNPNFSTVPIMKVAYPYV